MMNTPGNTAQTTTMTKEQKDKLFAVLYMFLIERNEQRDKVHAVEKVLEGTPGLAEFYKRELDAEQGDPRPSVDIRSALEELRQSLFG
jgi:hypothetical protein